MKRLPFSCVVAGMLAGIGFLICAPVAALWVLLHDDEIEYQVEQ